jgi:single-strand DNA-binding protein
MISAVIIGNIGQSPELKSVASTKLLSLRVASNEKVKDKTVTSWVNVNVWGNRAEALSKLLKKGTKIAARGSLSVNEYESNGVKRMSVELKADDIDILSSLQSSNKFEEAVESSNNSNDDEEPDLSFPAV